MRFGDYVKKLREAKSLTLTQAASELGMTPQRLCDIENGRRAHVKAPLPLMRKIALVYDHPLAKLIENTEFFEYEKTVIRDLLSDVEPLSLRIEATALDIVHEAREYTPEMEESAVRLHGLALELKTAISRAKARYSRGQSKPLTPSEHTPAKG